MKGYLCNDFIIVHIDTSFKGILKFHYERGIFMLTNSIATFKPIEYRTQRVLTTQQLAEVYETQPKNIHDNYSNNKDRFIDGVHYYILSGDMLRKFKASLPDNIGEPIKFAPSLFL